MQSQVKLRTRMILTRALRTMLMVLGSGVVTIIAFDMESIWLLLSATAFAGILSVLTGLVDLPEFAGHQNRWVAIISRTIKTFAQTIISLIPASAIFIGDVEWKIALVQGIVAALGTLLLATAKELPEEATATA